MMEERYLQETKMLDYFSPEIEKLVVARGWRSLPPSGRVKSIYSFVRDEILFGYNTDDSIPASRVPRPLRRLRTVQYEIHSFHGTPESVLNRMQNTRLHDS